MRLSSSKDLKSDETVVEIRFSSAEIFDVISSLSTEQRVLVNKSLVDQESTIAAKLRALAIVADRLNARPADDAMDALADWFGKQVDKSFSGAFSKALSDYPPSIIGIQNPPSITHSAAELRAVQQTIDNRLQANRIAQEVVNKSLWKKLMESGSLQKLMGKLDGPSE